LFAGVTKYAYSKIIVKRTSRETSNSEPCGEEEIEIAGRGEGLFL
jgi:hypothetical protein